MLVIRNVKPSEKTLVDSIVTIHLATFDGFFLTFMGRGFLNQMYLSYCEERHSGLLVAEDDGRAIGFLAYSGNMSGLYKYMIRTRLIPFAWHSVWAFLRKPSVFVHIISAFLKPSEARRDEKYIELASIGVAPNSKSTGVGSQLINKLKEIVDLTEYAYITLETDADDNDDVIRFYEKNGFVKKRYYETYEGRNMIEYQYAKEKNLEDTIS